GVCVDCAPSAQRCNILQPQTCDPTGHWANTGSPCPFLCSGGTCTGMCTPGSTQCNGNIAQTCDATGTFRDWQVCTACVAGVCTDCSPGSGRCQGLQPLLCDSTGHNQNEGTACSFVCSTTTPRCIGVCTPGSMQCINGTTPQTCDATGNWVSG